MFSEMKLLLFCTLALLLHSAWAAHDLAADYTFSATLLNDTPNDDSYELFWSFSDEQRTISFAVRVKTTGWIGFGLSPNGGMPNSDVVIGWVNGTEGYLHDRYAEAEARPPVDESQDWFLTNAEEENGYTTLEFTRDWNTCDDRDRVIDASTTRVIFSWNDMDPEDNDPNNVQYHGVTQRSSASLNLLGGLNNPPPEPSDSSSFFIGVTDIEIPGDTDTTYWCVLRRVPDVLLTQKHYIYKYSPAITSGNERYVHHVIVYQCGSLGNGAVDGDSGPCEEGTILNECRLGAVIGGWAVGGTDFIFPEGVAVPITTEFVVIEMHYDNPGLDQGVIDSSGINFFVTQNAPDQEAETITIGTINSPILMVPPNTESFTISAVCSTECTDAFLPPAGITVFANFFHTHLAGQSLVLEHYRVTEECGGLEELPPIDINPSYDFNYQQAVLLPEPRVVLPGDILIVRCTYNTTGRTGVTVGGRSTHEEMCYAFPIYYPKNNFSQCASVAHPDDLQSFIANYVPAALQAQFYSTLGDLYNRSGQEVQDIYNQLDWDQNQIQGLQDALSSNSIYSCESPNLDDPGIPDGEEPLSPTPKCDYTPVDECNKASSITASVFLLVAAIAFSVIYITTDTCFF